MRGMMTSFLIAGLTVSPAWAGGGHNHDHGHADLEVGQSAGNQIEVEYDFNEPFELAPVDGPLLFGCASDEPGFMSIDEDEPGEGLFTLPDGTEVLFELVAIDPGVLIHSPGFADIIDMPSESFSLGTVPFDVHPTWHIDATDPAWDPDGVYNFTFRLVDAGGTFDPSDEFIVTLVCAEPGACCLPSGECEEGEFEGACEEEGGTFLGEGSVCGPEACEITGACCLPNGTCEEEHEDHCLEEGGVFQGGGTTCNENACASVPTVSTWGLVVLSLLLIVAAKIRWRGDAIAS